MTWGRNKVGGQGRGTRSKISVRFLPPPAPSPPPHTTGASALRLSLPPRPCVCPFLPPAQRPDCLGPEPHREALSGRRGERPPGSRGRGHGALSMAGPTAACRFPSSDDWGESRQSRESGWGWGWGETEVHPDRPHSLPMGPLPRGPHPPLSGWGAPPPPGPGHPVVPVVVLLGGQRHAVQRVMGMQPLLLLQCQALQLSRLRVHGLQLVSCRHRGREGGWQVPVWSSCGQEGQGPRD